MHPARSIVSLVCRLGRPGALLFLSCLLLYGSLSTYALAVPKARVSVIVSRSIAPYLEALEGLKSGLAQRPDITLQAFFLEKMEVRDRLALFQGPDMDDPPHVYVTIGPEALSVLREGLDGKRAFSMYLMVLNPEQAFGLEEKDCGIPLNIPVETQVEMVRQGLPSIKRPGLLYDPDINSDFFDKAKAAATRAGMDLQPLRIAEKRDIPPVLAPRWTDLDALWLIPDRTVISESIIKYLIKESFLKRIPVIGYNRFFYETGAAMAFIFDYRELGLQGAHMALRMLADEPCHRVPPVFDVWVNGRVASGIGLSLPETYPSPIRYGP